MNAPSSIPAPAITRLQRFFAHDWLLALWFGGWMLGVAARVVVIAESSVAALLTWTGATMFVVSVGLALVVGALLALVVGAVVLPPIYWWRVRVNGGPFEKGDRVWILAGPHRGQVGTVAGSGQGLSHLVGLGADAPTESEADSESQLQADSEPVSADAREVWLDATQLLKV